MIEFCEVWFLEVVVGDDDQMLMRRRRRDSRSLLYSFGAPPVLQVTVEMCDPGSKPFFSDKEGFDKLTRCLCIPFHSCVKRTKHMFHSNKSMVPNISLFRRDNLIVVVIGFLYCLCLYEPAKWRTDVRPKNTCCQKRQCLWLESYHTTYANSCTFFNKEQPYVSLRASRMTERRQQ